MIRSKKLILGIMAIFLVLSMMGAASAGLFDFGQPSRANPDDEVFEDIGGDEFLNATLKGCVKLGEEYIPDEGFSTSDGEFAWLGAKKISYVDVNGNKGAMIVWDTSPNAYLFNTSKDVNQYVSCYLLDKNAKAFIEYSYENNRVYGIILACDNIPYTESDLMYDVLGLNPDGFNLVYSDTGTSYAQTSASSSSSSGGDHYHTVVPDRYTLSRTDPDSYYDHYEYGDNYDIDDYLESEGYD